MIFNVFKIKLLKELLKDMIDAGMVDDDGKFTEQAKNIQRQLAAHFTAFNFFISNCNFERVWLAKSIADSTKHNNWMWSQSFPDETTDDEFLKIINDNRKIYNLPMSKYGPTEMSMAARLLDDEMQYEI